MSLRQLQPQQINDRASAKDKDLRRPPTQHKESMTLETTTSGNAAVFSFDDMALATFLKETIKTVGYTTPTPIQAGAIPLVLEGRDLIGLAQTGTGKTAAFVLPLLQKLSNGKKRGVQAIILAPTRELAEQINDVIKLFAPRTGIRSVTIYGGVSHRGQIAQLRANAQLVVACPGRLMDHIRGGTIDLSGVDHLILDEADRMLDMGFMPDIKAIIAELPVERQTLLFSATMPEEISSLAQSVLRDPTTVKVKSEEPVALVTHSMMTVKQEEKGEALASWLRGNPEALVVVFTKMKHTAKRLGDRLTKDGVPATALHGNLSQAQRQKALKGFRDGKCRALIATDIASRGIDVEGVTHVINYDMPDTLDAYIHRTGRAGRASREGSAVSFVTRGDRFILRDIEKWLGKSLERLNGGNDELSEEPRERRSSEGRARRPRISEGRPERSGARGGAKRFDRPNRRSRDNEGRPERKPREDGRSDARRTDTRRADTGRTDTGRTDTRNRRFDREEPRRFDRDENRRFGRDENRSFDRGENRRGDRKPGRFERDAGFAGRDRRRDEKTEERRPWSGSESRPARSGSFGRKPRGEGRPSFSRSNGRSGDASNRRERFSDKPSRDSKSFRGQADISPNSDAVYKERKPYFIEGGLSRGNSNRPGRTGAKWGGRGKRGPAERRGRGE